ncbi:MAG: hypothetical protein HYV15_06175, partial [Elusimicrobia bacterium]|nr:hypothetical protein [Elusimicrobiota bacterium]
MASAARLLPALLCLAASPSRAAALRAAPLPAPALGASVVLPAGSLRAPLL